MPWSGREHTPLDEAASIPGSIAELDPAFTHPHDFRIVTLRLGIIELLFTCCGGRWEAWANDDSVRCTSMSPSMLHRLRHVANPIPPLLLAAPGWRCQQKSQQKRTGDTPGGPLRERVVSRCAVSVDACRNVFLPTTPKDGGTPELTMRG